MESFKIVGGKRLEGKIKVDASKNALLPILAAVILTGEDVILRECPDLIDVRKMLGILKKLGCKTKMSGSDIFISCKNAQPNLVDCSLTGEIRSSIFILGPILSRFRQAKICYPGGCEIGLRPIDLHINGLKQLNVKIVEENGVIVCDGSEMCSGEVCLDFPSVGATENLIMAGVNLVGTTIIRNAAREPEIVDLASFLNVLGAKVYGAGTDTVCVEGVKTLRGGTYTPMFDRIVAGTLMTACAVTGGDVTLTNCYAKYMYSTIEKIKRCGCRVNVISWNELRVLAPNRLRGIGKTETQPFPGFPTDMQPQTVAMLSVSDGVSMVVENLFENRFKYTMELRKMGADVTVKDRVVIVRGVGRLHGAVVTATDLRAGAALVVAGLNADGESVVNDVRHVDRGYCKFEDMLTGLGANINRIYT